jgi:hypothetical protein
MVRGAYAWWCGGDGGESRLPIPISNEYQNTHPKPRRGDMMIPKCAIFELQANKIWE